VTPDQRHNGEAVKIFEQRGRVYEQAWELHPRRWTRSTHCWSQPGVVWINPPSHPADSETATLAAAACSAAASSFLHVTGVECRRLRMVCIQPLPQTQPRRGQAKNSRSVLTRLLKKSHQ
jgi:hypothetical protein